MSYPSGFAVTYGYNATGYQNQLADAATAKVYWTAEARDAELHLTKQTSGNGVTAFQVFDPNTGLLTNITAGAGGAVQKPPRTGRCIGRKARKADQGQSVDQTSGSEQSTLVEGPSGGLALRHAFAPQVRGGASMP